MSIFQPSYEVVEEKLNAIETEMMRIGMWQKQDLSPEQKEIRSAFGQGVITFEQWLQFIFIPNVRTIIANKGKFPGRSEVAAKAVREWVVGGELPETEPLRILLQEFDNLF